MDNRFSPLSLILPALAAGALTLLGPAPSARAEDDGMTFEQRMIDKLMKGLGATDGTEAGIEYRERSPLVVPQTLNLPPPEQAGAQPAPNWPNDPDVAERKARRAASARQSEPSWAEGRPLTQEELAKGRNPNAGRVTLDGQLPRREGDRLSARELGYNGDIFSKFFRNGGTVEETATFKGEPSRNVLTDPPTGYQTPSSGYAYGSGGKENSAALPDQEGKPIAPGKF